MSRTALAEPFCGFVLGSHFARWFAELSLACSYLLRERWVPQDVKVSLFFSEETACASEKLNVD